jgi:hypothetical protein
MVALVIPTFSSNLRTLIENQPITDAGNVDFIFD